MKWLISTLLIVGLTLATTVWAEESASSTGVIPDKLRLGSFLVSPSITFAEIYDDNIFATDTMEQDDFITITTPSITLASAWKEHELNFTAGSTISAHATHDNEDTVDAWADVEGRYDFTPMTNIFGGIGMKRDHEDRSSPDDQNGLKPTIFREYHSHLGLYHESGPVTLRVGTTYEYLNYDDVEARTVGDINNDDRDRAMSSFGARVGYRLSPVYEVFAQAANDVRNYTDKVDDNLQDRDSDGYRYAVGLKIKRPRFSGQFLVGHLEQDYDDPVFEKVSELDFGAKLTWYPNLNTVVTANVDRTLEETTLVNASSYLYTVTGVEIKHKLAPRVVISAQGQYANSDYQGIRREDDYRYLALGLQYELARHLYVDANYNYATRDSNVAGEDFDRHSLYFQLRADIAPGFASGPLMTASAGNTLLGQVPADVSGFYAGLQVGYGGLSTTLDGPRGGPDGYLLSDFGDHGSYAGIFAGYGIRFANSWYLGLDAEFNDSNNRWDHARLPGGRVFSVNSGDSYAFSARLGYMFNNGNLLYGRAGIVRTDFATDYTMDDGEIFDDSDSVNGYRFGAGTEIPISEHFFWRMDYAYTDYETYRLDFGTGRDSMENSEGVIQFGLGWRATRQFVPNRRSQARERLSGFYVGAGFGYGQLDTEQNAIHNEPGRTSNFAADFGDHGATWGLFAGWGHVFDRVYLGVEVGAEDAMSNWEHLRDPTGRNFSVDKTDGYSARLRLGYVMKNGTLIYGHYGRVKTDFKTVYIKGNNTTAWVDRYDTETGERFGLGAEVPVTDNLFWRMDYSYTDYDNYSFITTHAEPDTVDWDNSESLFSVGLGWRF